MRAFLGLGANIGNREANLRTALQLLSRRCVIAAVSSLYRSEAIVLEGTPQGPDFMNAACEVETDLSPMELLGFVKEIEHEMGRRPAERWAPRIIDIDVLLVGGVVMTAPELTLPHEALADRNFVLVPLAELAPAFMHPLLNRTIGALAEDVDLAGLEHLLGPEWADGPVANTASGADDDA